MEGISAPIETLNVSHLTTTWCKFSSVHRRVLLLSHPKNTRCRSIFGSALLLHTSYNLGSHADKPPPNVKRRVIFHPLNDKDSQYSITIYEEIFVIRVVGRVFLEGWDYELSGHPHVSSLHCKMFRPCWRR